MVNKVEIQWTDDWHAYGKVHAAAYRSAYRGLMDDHYLSGCTVENRESYYRLLAAIGRTAILTADSRDAGCLAVGSGSAADIDDGRIYGEIDAIYLLPNTRGRGYGQRLLGWALDRFQEKKYSSAILWVLERNVSAIAFYERCGFKRDGAVRTIERGGPLKQVRMRLEMQL